MHGLKKMKCPICNKEFEYITNTHLRTHNTTAKAAIMLYPNRRLDLLAHYKHAASKNDNMKAAVAAMILDTKNNPAKYSKSKKKAYLTRVKRGNHYNWLLAQHENKTGWFDSELQSRMGKRGGKIGGKISARNLRKKKNIKWWNVNFDSLQEREAAKLLLKRPQPGKNYQIEVGSKSFDFLIGDIFIEYHPFDFTRTVIEYYDERRKSLDENGFEDYKLVVLKSIRETEQFAEGTL